MFCYVGQLQNTGELHNSTNSHQVWFCQKLCLWKFEKHCQSKHRA